jgi:hypothetical protein
MNVRKLLCMPLPDGRWLAMDQAAFRAALAAGAELMPPSPAVPAAAPVFVDAAEMARLTGTAPSWWEAAARNLDCPCLFIGQCRRFKVAEALAWLDSVQERSVDGRAVRCGAAPRANA